jgi:tRNA pseudouridine32 synthase/23S rRNA pseudouridine746 synthase/23S rRNA pseudouridine1911/1915/1917 synthase
MPKPKLPSRRHQPPGLTILHDDKDILVVDKEAGLLTVATDREKEKTAHCLLTNYIRKGCAKSNKQLFVVHRLDRDTSGVLLFAKSESAKDFLQDHWPETRKTYLAVVHGKLAEKEGVISSHLTENEAYVVYSTSDTRKGKLSHTAYRVVKETRNFSLLEINLLTGRKNQIRVHLSEHGHPIVGDRKYGHADDPHRKLALHARSISFKHPFRKTDMFFETGIPEYFSKLVGNLERCKFGKPFSQP